MGSSVSDTSSEAGSSSAVSKHVVDRWRDLWRNARTDAAWVERHRLRDEKRTEILPQIRDLVAGFLSGTVSLGELKTTFDRKTRNEWDLFGLKGPNGAMFLNKLANHLPPEANAAAALRQALVVPTDDSDARMKLQAFMDYLDRQIEGGVATRLGLQPNRAPFLVSACWHVQQPNVWPIAYLSIRRALQDQGVLGYGHNAVNGYLELVVGFRALAEALGISFWDLEHLCVRFQSATTVEEDDEPDAAESASHRQQVWLIAPGQGAYRFDEFYTEGIIAIGWDYLGDLSEYSDQDAIRKAIQAERGDGINPIQDTLACYQFAQEMAIGDVVFAKRGRREIIGYGVITSGYRHEPQREQYHHVRSVLWKNRGSWVPRERSLVLKTLTEISRYPGLVQDIQRAVGIGEGDQRAAEPEIPVRGYSIDHALQDLFLPRAEVEEALELLRYKKNLVLQGPPGVGKTFVAKHLAYLLLGEQDKQRLEQVQFHQSYSYDDFVQGYRPVEGKGFDRVDGPFIRFCDQALQDGKSPYVLVIDEINRGNLSKIFGELLMLIEGDKRDERWATTLAYSREGEPRFYVPDNLYVIGTMNTADRSLAMVDYALRRRFAFVDVHPGFGHDGFVQRLDALGVTPSLRGRIVAHLTRLNERIAQDAALGEGFCIGHSYFCHAGSGPADEGWYGRIVRTEIAPLLREYWFDDQKRASEEVARLLEDG
jgi:hypothetical protein